MPTGARIPAFVNSSAGSAEAAREAIAADPRFELRETTPRELPDALRAEVARGTPRVVVAGGDGTVTLAARALAGTSTALAVLPGGTLNHFARDLGLPADDAAACLECAVRGEARPVDAATLNGELFLNTSSAGVYVQFVRIRERIERWGLGYHLATLLATLWTWLRLHAFSVMVRAGGRPGDPERLFRSPLVFVAVGERALAPPDMGQRIAGGARALQLMIVETASRMGVIALIARMAAGGLDDVAGDPALDVSLVDACELRMRRPWGRVAMDGELARLRAPLHYRIAHDALLAVVPPGDLAARPFAAGGG